MPAKSKLSVIRSDIETLFPDNSSGEITASDVRLFLNKLVDNMQFEGGGLRQVTPISGQTVGVTPQKITGLSQSVVIGDAISVDVTTNTITVQYDGVYSLSGNLSLEYATNVLLSVYPSINGVKSGIESASLGSGINKPIQIALPAGEIVLSTGDTFELYGNTDSSTSVIIDSGYIQLVYRPLSDYT